MPHTNQPWWIALGIRCYTTFQERTQFQSLFQQLICLLISRPNLLELVTTRILDTYDMYGACFPVEIQETTDSVAQNHTPNRGSFGNEQENLPKRSRFTSKEETEDAITHSNESKS